MEPECVPDAEVVDVIFDFKHIDIWLMLHDSLQKDGGRSRKVLIHQMKEFMKKDRAQHTILPLSKFGLMQITRQRVRPEVRINTAEVCPTCEGSGKINPTVLLTDDIERDLVFILQSRPKSKIKLTVHPFVEAYLKKGIPSQQHKWWLKHQKWIGIKSAADLPVNKYIFYDENDDEIRLN